jgi:transcriptional regulator with XRE-family HTH domain
MDLRTTINNRIAELRASVVVSQADLARRLGITSGHLNAELSGHRPLSDERRSQIESLLDVDLRPDRWLAHHEAGHAVVAVALGSTTSTVRPDADGWACESWWDGKPDPISRCAVALAGIAAELLLEAGSIDAHDVADALDNWRIEGVEPGSDAATVDELDLSDADELRAADLAATAVTRHWAVICRVAGELVDGLPSVTVTKKNIEGGAR